jgi:ribosomal protein S18 acetylase RimI-like enzyme
MTDIIAADLDDPAHAAAIVDIIDSYAADPAGGGVPLSDDVRRRLVPGLREHASTLVLLAYETGAAVGAAVCFFGYSTFKAMPLLNIHDLAVVPGQRGRGIGRALLDAAEEHARERGCCKLTLEVQEANAPARGLYRSFGFREYTIGDWEATRFLEKPIV